MRQSEAWQGSGAKGSHTVTVTSTPAVPKTAASIAALLDTLNASGRCAFVISPDENPGMRPTRLVLGMLGSDTGDTSIDEELYTLSRMQSDKDIGQVIRIERLLTAKWTLSSTSISFNGASLLECKAVTVVDDGVLEARGGKAAAAISREPASVEIFDTGDGVGILRVCKRSASSGAASGVPIHKRWE